MRRGVDRTPRSRADLLEASLYLDEQSVGLGDRFLDAAEATFEQLVETPGLGGIREFAVGRLQGLRSWRISGFENWLVFYRVTDAAVEIVRVLHGARDVEAAFEREEPND